MKRLLASTALALTIAMAAAPAYAEVKKEERNQVSFSGMLGRMFNFFGGKSAKEGVVSTVAVSGDRSTFMTINNEVLKIASNLTAAEVAMPTGFKETK